MKNALNNSASLHLSSRSTPTPLARKARRRFREHNTRARNLPPAPLSLTVRRFLESGAETIFGLEAGREGERKLQHPKRERVDEPLLESDANISQKKEEEEDEEEEEAGAEVAKRHAGSVEKRALTRAVSARRVGRDCLQLKILQPWLQWARTFHHRQAGRTVSALWVWGKVHFVIWTGSDIESRKKGVNLGEPTRL